MVKRLDRGADGLYHVKGKTYKNLSGKRPQVWHGNAYKTSGGLVKADLMKNPWGKIVARHVSQKARKQNHLGKYRKTSKDRGKPFEPSEKW
jgi:hypothetical protein